MMAVIRKSLVSGTLAALVALAGLAGSPRLASAQDPAPRDTSRRVAIRLLASASADEVRFSREPRIEVRLRGALDSVRVLERRNLPRPVVAGQTYRNVYIAVEILGRLDADCIASRLGVADSTRGRGACAALSIDGIAPDSTGKSP